MKYLIYALGGGWGHLNRCLSLAVTQASCVGTKNQVSIIINSPYFPYIQDKINSIYCNFINPETNFQETCKIVQEIVLKNDYNCLIIDTFPRGLGGELTDILPTLKAKKILIHRDLNPRYIQVKNLEEFVFNNYDLILIPGDGENLPFSHFPNTYITKPWLIKNYDQLISFDQAYFLLKINHKLPQQKVIIILASGEIKELEIYGEIANILNKNNNYIVRIISAIKPQNCPQEIWQFYYPAIDILPIADIIIGGGGYNTISEAITLKIPLIVLPQPRLYDRQITRIKRVVETGNNQVILIRNIPEIITAINYLLQNAKIKPNLNYENGVLDAIKKIESLLL